MDSTTGPLVPPMPRRETPAVAVGDVPSGYGDGHALPLAVPSFPEADGGTISADGVTYGEPKADVEPAQDVTEEPVPGGEVEEHAVEEVPAAVEADTADSDGDDVAATLALLDDSANEPTPVEAPVAEPAPAPVAEPAPAASKGLVIVRDGVVISAPVGTLVVDVNDLLHPEADVDYLFGALKTLREVAPSEARDSLVEQVTAAMKDRMGF